MAGWKDKLKLRLPAIILMAATVLFWTFYDRYEQSGSVLLEAPVRADGTKARGDVAQTGEQFRLHVPEGGPMAQIDLPLPAFAAEHDYIRLQGRMKVEDVVEGQHSWNRARIILVQYDRNKKWIPGLEHVMVGEYGSMEWRVYEGVFEIDENCAHAVVILQQSGLAGTACFDQLRAYPVRLRALFPWWRFWFALSWLLLAAVYFTRCRLHRRPLKVLIILNIIAILAGTLLPGRWIQGGLDWTKEIVHERMAPEPRPAAAPSPAVKPAAQPSSGRQQVDWFAEVEERSHQAGHFVLFASLCFLVYLSAALERKHPIYFFKVGADMLLFAAITESLQFLTSDRSAGLLDLQIDLCGMGLAMLIFLAVLPLVRRRQAGT